MSELKAYILCQFAAKSSIYHSWLDGLSMDVEIVDENLADWQVPRDAGILITHMHYRWEELSFLREQLDRGERPILILADGILEYRNTWENPGLVKGSLFQPIFGHKLACLGNAQARIVESWGNSGKCEVVGLPRLDHLTPPEIKQETSDSVHQISKQFRIMVATANTPAFDERQHETVARSLDLLKNWFEKNPKIGDRQVELIWRLSAGLDDELLADESIDDFDGKEGQPPLAEVFETVDAVITTPSTIFLESAIRGLPTAVLDFHHCPQYLSPAWTLGSADHFDGVIPELARPCPRKMRFQQTVLHDQLECATPAKPRMIELIEKMVEIGKKQRSEGQKICLPTARLLARPPARDFETQPILLADVFPDVPEFEIEDRQRLQIELIAARQRLGELPVELAEKQRYIAKLR
ncbi:MAG: hypothetical protein AAF939_21555, partial [Planctomycetota bacterium]